MTPALSQLRITCSRSVPSGRRAQRLSPSLGTCSGLGVARSSGVLVHRPVHQGGGRWLLTPVHRLRPCGDGRDFCRIGTLARAAATSSGRAVDAARRGGCRDRRGLPLAYLLRSHDGARHARRRRHRAASGCHGNGCGPTSPRIPARSFLDRDSRRRAGGPGLCLYAVRQQRAPALGGPAPVGRRCCRRGPDVEYSMAHVYGRLVVHDDPAWLAG